MNAPTIDIRTPLGWLKIRHTTGSHICGLCSAKLWIAPHGGKYCDRMHDCPANP